MQDPWDRFAEPPRAFSPVPLWWWSGERVTAERLRWQLERLVAGGVFNVVVMNVAPTSPLYGKDADDPPFMSEAWWALFEGVCRDAEELGVSLWFYDQIGFSGANFQGQVVQRHPEHAGRWLEREVVEGEGPLAVDCPAGGTPVGAVALTPGGALEPVALDGRNARFAGPGRLMLFYAVERGFDYFSAPACERLFGMVHGRFEARVGERFGSVIVGSFQDELPDLPTWSPDFAAQFAAHAGYDPIPHLAALWEDLGAAGERFRGDYHRVRGALAETAFFQPLHAWHERHGLLCGVDQQYGGRDGQPVASSRALRRLRAHPPLVQRPRLRPPRRRQDPLLDRPPLQPPARVDRVLPHLRLGRHAGGDLRLAAALDRRRREPLQPARDLLLHARGLVGVGAARDRLAAAVLAPLRAVRAGGGAPVRDAHVGAPRVRRRGAVPGGDGARGAAARRGGGGGGARGRASTRT